MSLFSDFMPYIMLVTILFTAYRAGKAIHTQKMAIEELADDLIKLGDALDTLYEISEQE